MSEVIDVQKIVLKNIEALEYANTQSPYRKAMDKILRLSVVSGKTQYWSYKLFKKIMSICEDIEKIRIKLIEENCKKDTNGKPILTGGEYQFTTENKKLYEEEFRKEALKENPDLEALSLKYCKRDTEGNPIKSTGNQYTFSEEGLEKFKEAWNEVVMIDNTFAFPLIKVTPPILEKMNANKKPEECLTIGDMFLLEKFFEFTEE